MKNNLKKYKKVKSKKFKKIKIIKGEIVYEY